MAQLISSVCKRRGLWDKKHVHHHNRYKLDKLWDEVGAETNMTRLEARKKWKNIRDRFRIELRKQSQVLSAVGLEDERTGSDSETIDTPESQEDLTGSSWLHFEKLMFLKDQFTPRPNKSDLIKDSTIPSESPSTRTSTRDASTLDLEGECFNETEASTPSPSLSSVSSRDHKRQRLSRNEGYHQQLLRLEEKKLAILTGNNKGPPLSSFFDSLLPHVAKLSDEKQMLLQMEIQQCVYKHVYGDSLSSSSA